MSAADIIWPAGAKMAWLARIVELIQAKRLDTFDMVVAFLIADQTDRMTVIAAVSVAYFKRRTGKSERTIERAISRLERGGCLKREKTGRGRLYRPQIGTKHPSSVTGIADQHPSSVTGIADQHPSSVTENTRHPCRVISKEESPTRVHAHTREAEPKRPEQRIWSALLGELNNALSPSDVRSWLSPLQPRGFRNGELMLEAPSPVVRDQVKNRYFSEVRAACEAAAPSVELVSVIYRGEKSSVVRIDGKPKGA